MAKYRPTIKDRVLRLGLGISNEFRYFFKVKKKKEFNIPNNYKLIYSDNFSNDFNLGWESSADWWQTPYHPEELSQWYDKDQIVNSNSGLAFYAQQKPKYFPEIDTIIPNAIGSIRSKPSWQYGIFTFSVKLPAGTQLWPALWLTGRWSWPPEIDIVEGYSGNTNDYKRNKKLFSNVHVTYNGNKISTRGFSHKLPVKVTENFIEYILWWEKDFVKIYYNGYLVRKITDKKILNNLNESHRVIIGTGLQKDFNTNNITPLIIEDFKVFQKN